MRKKDLLYEKLKNFIRNKNKKSIVELDLNKNDINRIVNLILHFKYDHNNLNKKQKTLVGLFFLIYVIHRLKFKISYDSIWKVIINDLQTYSKSISFIKNYFNREYPNNNLKESIELACKKINLRNDFFNRKEHQYLRNTILLQVGLLDKSLKNIRLWLSNYNLPVILSELLDINSENYSKEFNEGWRVLRRFRDNILSIEQTKNILSQNIWFKHLNLDELLKLAKEKSKKQLPLNQDDDLPIFYLDKIYYSDDSLIFMINAQDLYALNLNGFRYEIYIDNEYKGLLIANSSKELTLESPITILDPEVNYIELEVRNEDNDVVYATDIILFDFTEQLILFDENGNIYRNIFKKLNPHKKYHILMDSDLDCNFNHNIQREYFEGYATLIPNITYKDNCKITYNNEILFELNFTEYIEKPEFIDHLVLYTKTDSSFILKNEYLFELKIMQIDLKTEEVDLKSLPKEAKIIRWSYLGGYADTDDIQNNTIIAKLFPEMITLPKHTLLIKYKNRVFKKVVYCNFFERQNQYRLFQIHNDGTTQLVDGTSYLTKYDLKKYRYYLSDFNRTEQFYVKNKSNFYQTIKPNKLINFTNFNGFGETIFIAEHLFNSELIKIFDYRNSDEYISINQDKLNEIIFHKDLPIQSKLILLDQNLIEYEMSYQEIQKNLKNNKIYFQNELVSVLVIQGSSVVDSSYNECFLDNFNDYINTDLMKNLLISNYPFLTKKSHTKILRNSIMYNLEEFFSIFYNNKITINKSLVGLDFSKINILIEHILFTLDFSQKESENILKELILNKREQLLLETPIILFKLLQSCNSKELIGFFYNLIYDAELLDDRDETFTELIVNNLFTTKTISGIQKHNLKIAMHYINGKYYLKKALERLND